MNVLFLDSLLEMQNFWKGLCASSLILAALLGFVTCGCVSKKVSLNPNRATNFSHRIAIIPFESSNPYLSGIVFSDYFTVQILQTFPRLQVIERKDLLKILQEQRLTLSGITRPEKFSKLGTVLGVDAILLGSIQTLKTLQGGGGSISVMAKLMEISTGKVIWADREKSSLRTLTDHEVTEVADQLMAKTVARMLKKMEQDFTEAFSRLEMQELSLTSEARLPLGSD